MKEDHLLLRDIQDKANTFSLKQKKKAQGYDVCRLLLVLTVI